ncbi:hypothetical protein ES703_108267 [subsurface metagenome]
MVKPKIFLYLNLLFKALVLLGLFSTGIILNLIMGIFLDFRWCFFFGFCIPFGILCIILLSSFILWYFIFFCERMNEYQNIKSFYLVNFFAESFFLLVIFNASDFLSFFILGLIALITGIIYFFLKRAEIQGIKPTLPPQKGIIELKRGIDFVGGLIRYKIAIKNSSETVISNMELSLKMAARHIRIVDIKPRVYKKSDRALIETIPPGQSLSIDFYLEPMICGTILVAPVAIFIDAWGKTQTLTRESINVVSKCPPIINAGEENIAKVENIYGSENIIRSFRSFELEYDPIKSISLLMEAIGAWAGKHVSEPIIKSETPFKGEVYYYVLNQNPDPELGHQEQIILKINVDEENNVAMIHVGAEKNVTVNGVLTHIWELANTRFSEVFGLEFKSLHCLECGASIKYMDKHRPTIICETCGTEFDKKSIKKN